VVQDVAIEFLFGSIHVCISNASLFQHSSVRTSSAYNNQIFHWSSLAVEEMLLRVTICGAFQSHCHNLLFLDRFFPIVIFVLSNMMIPRLSSSSLLYLSCSSMVNTTRKVFRE
jgi:hypothetical protein